MSATEGERMGDAPHWDADGQPENLAAAAADALEWLRWLGPRLKPTSHQRERLQRATEALKAAIAATEQDSAAK